VLTGLVVVVLIVIAIAVVEIVALGWNTSDSSKKAGPAAIVSVGTPIDPAFFASGACLAFAPSAGDRHQTVFLDAGHGGIDPGGVGATADGQTIHEADETLPVELDAMALLRAKGYRVVVSRAKASTVLRLGPADTDAGVLSVLGAHDDVAARDVCANDARANILVGIYFDAGGSSQNAGSITAYDADRPFSAANIKLAGLLQADVLADMDAQGWDIPNDGTGPDTSLGSIAGNPADGGLAAAAAAYDHLLLIGPAAAGYFSNPSEMPGAVIEPLYITDPFEGSIANGPTGRRSLRKGSPPPSSNISARRRKSSPVALHDRRTGRSTGAGRIPDPMTSSPRLTGRGP
jgi:N-acetylmuramoyl-L-alanine amidase